MVFSCFTMHYTVMGRIRLMGTLLFSATCENIFLTFNYKIRFSFALSMNTNLFSSNKKGKKTQQKEICSEMSHHIKISFRFPKVGGVIENVIPSVISAYDDAH